MVNPSNKIYSFLLGSYLGDGSVLKPQTKNSNCYLRIQHSIKQKDYIDWKYNLFKDFISSPLTIHRKIKDTEYICVTVQTKVHPFCTRLRKLYKFNKINNRFEKTINESILSYLNEFGLAIWYMDDGSIVRRKHNLINGTKSGYRFRGIKIATCSFSEEEIQMLLNLFKRKWNLNLKVYYSKKQEKLYPILEIHGAEAKRFIEIIKPYVPECMKYKIDIQQEIL